ncbi:MAG: hypothetical protein JJT81_20345, partial [Rubellimicrobium sp.]|nr:hypothetical protein [Rubellimicrobium sp.]
TAEMLLEASAARPAGDGAARTAAAQAGLAELERPMRGDLALLDLVRDTLPEAMILGDSTQCTYAGNLGFCPAWPGGYGNSATGYGTLGYGLPAAIGASLARSGTVVSPMGDGGLQFCLGELASAVEAEAQVILLLYDNKGYGEIKSSMVAQNVPPIGVDIFTPDLAAIARASNWAVTGVETPEALAEALAEAATRKGPTLVHYDDTLRRAFRARL